MEISVNDSSFDRQVVEQSKKIPVLVDFWASWCGPCNMLSPILENIAEDYEGKIIVAKISVEQNQEIPTKYNIMSIPAVKLFIGEKVVGEFVGVRDEEEIREWIDSFL